MWRPEQNWAQQGSFAAPVPIPGADPADAPQVCVSFNASWLPYILGALAQLVQPTTWAASDPAALLDAQSAATKLIELVGLAEGCTMLRFDPPTCELQVSTDNGVTWTEVPGWASAFACFVGPAGPSGASGGNFRPDSPVAVAGQSVDQAACNIAAYLTQYLLRAAVNQAISGYNTSRLEVDSVAAIAALALGLDPIVDLILGAGAVLVNAVASSTISEFSNAEADAVFWSQVQCAIYAAIAPAGAVTGANYATVLANLTALPGTYPTVRAALVGFTTALSAVGLQQAQISGTLYQGDCTSCHSNNCGNFNGTDGYAAPGAQLPINGGTDWTIAAWIKSRGYSSIISRTILWGSTGTANNYPLITWYIDTSSPGHIVSFLRDANVHSSVLTGPAIGSDALWHHVVMVWHVSSRLHELYVDGQLAASGTMTGAGSVTRGLALVGADNSAGGPLEGFWDGAMHDLQQYTVPLTAAQVQQLYLVGDAGVTNAAFVSRWNFDEGSGTVAGDSNPSGDIPAPLSFHGSGPDWTTK